MRKPGKTTRRDLSRPRHEFAEKITPLRLADDGQRATRISEVVEAFVRLRGSVARFTAMLGRDVAPDEQVFARPAAQPSSFLAQLSALAQLARQTQFRRIAELDRIIERAAQAEAHRDVIFLPAPAAADAMQRAAKALERLDAAFVGLCVEHVLERNTREVSSVAALA